MAQTKINKTVGKIFTGLHGKLYQLTNGKLGAGGKLQGASVIVLSTTGRKSGKTRERPVLGFDHEDGWVVIASYSGHDEHPAWYRNLQANPAASVQLGGENVPVTARETSGEERHSLWDKSVALNSDFGEYQAVTEREIPLLVLERAAS